MYGIRHNFYALVMFVAVVPCPSLHLPYAVMEFLSLAVSTDSPNCKLFFPALPAEAVIGIIEKIHIGLFGIAYIGVPKKYRTNSHTRNNTIIVDYCLGFHISTVRPVVASTFAKYVKLSVAMDVHNGGLEAKMEPWRVCRPLVAADSHHFDEGQDPYRNWEVKGLIRIPDPQPCVKQHRSGRNFLCFRSFL